MVALTNIRRLGMRLRTDEDGTTVMEFGLMVTVFMTLLLGLFDIGQTAYANAIIKGAAQKAARTSSLEIANVAQSDAEIEKAIQTVAPGAVVKTTRVSYFDFEDIERPETWGDENDNSTCDDGESYIDENGNDQWDADVGSEGNGGAGDVVIYTVTATYEPLFPNPFLPGGAANRTISASTVKKNQPFADQEANGTASGVCE